MPQQQFPVESVCRPYFYVVRNGTTFVPLIPADELPAQVQLEGLPRVLNSDQVFFLQCVGNLPSTRLVYKLRDNIARSTLHGRMQSTGHSRLPSDKCQSVFQAPDAVARQAIVISPRPAHANAQTLGRRPSATYDSVADWRRTQTINSQSLIDKIVSTTAGAAAAAQYGYTPTRETSPPPSGITPDQTKKVYCSYWIRSGECDYTQQGCRFKHEMPTDPKVRANLGLKETPKWYLERHGAIKKVDEKRALQPTASISSWFGKSTDEKTVEPAQEEEQQAVRSVLRPLKVKAEQKIDEDEVKVGSKSILQPTKVKSEAKPEPSQTTSTSFTESTPRQLPQDDQRLANLIDFEPLVASLPASSSATATSSSREASAGSTDSRSFVRVKPPPSTKPTSKQRHDNNNRGAAIFLPAGESSSKHVTSAKWRSRNGASRRDNAFREAQWLDVLSYDKRQNPNGLMASRHAPPPRGPPNRRSARTGCRPRKPAAAGSAAASGPTTPEKNVDRGRNLIPAPGSAETTILVKKEVKGEGSSPRLV